ncbi:MAG: PQQ-dependent sugar dehydrogenase [Anaerolineae bacterium]
MTPPEEAQPATPPGPTTPPSLPLPTPSPPPFPPQIALEPVLGGLRQPLFVTHAGQDEAGASRLYVVEKAGRILAVENVTLQVTPFLDITDRVGSARNEQGLLSVAFPPDSATSGLFYVNYTNQRGDTVIARYRRMADNPAQADPNSEHKILQIEQPAANHNGGQLQFGPDGYLYIGTGDGGQAGDPWGNAQNQGVLLGKMLRIDVTGNEAYTIPGDNPLLGQAGARPEIWATGLRNPWRFSFDRATGDLYIADVGQNLYEELNFQPALSPGGENYGWDVMEGNHCFEPASGCDTEGLVLPVAEYDHSQGCSITGGYVYRGTRYPQLTGIYFFGDFCSGNIWGVRQKASGEWETARLLNTGLNIASFGEDADGEIYVVDYREGVIYHLVASS